MPKTERKNLNLIKPLDLISAYRKYRREKNKVNDIMNLSTESRKLNTLQGNFLVSSTPTKKIKIAREKNKQGKGNIAD